MVYALLGGTLLSETVVPSLPQLSAQDRSTYERGRSMQRVVMAIQNPRVCAIVLLRQRCVGDFDRAFGDLRTGPLPKLREAMAAGDLRPVLSDVGDMNVVHVPDQEWVKNPREAWLLAAGETSVAVPAAIGNPLLQLVAGVNATDLAKHAGAAGPFDVLIPANDAKSIAQATPDPSTKAASNFEPIGLAFDRLMPYENALATNLEEAFPSSAFPYVTYPDGVVGDLRAGVAVAAVNEMLERPDMIFEPDVQSFIDGLFVHLGNAAGDGAREDLRTARQSLRPAEVAAGVASRSKSKDPNPYQSFLKAIFHVPHGRYVIMLYGMFAAQGAYNAVVIRDVRAAQMMQQQVATDPSYDTILPGLSEARQSLAHLHDDDWAAQSREFTAVVGTILGSQ